MHSQRGQSLIELVVGIGIGVLFVTAAVGVVTLSLRLDFQNKFSQTAGELSQATIEQVSTFANADWHNVYGNPKSMPLHLVSSAGFLAMAPGSSTVTIDSVNYETSYRLETVCRDASDAFIDCAAGGTVDPSTLQVFAATQWQQNESVGEIELSHYITRIRDRIWLQSDWSTGSSSWDGSTPFTEATMSGALFRNATNTQWTTANQITIYNTAQNLQTTAGNGIDSTYRYSWNDVIGWFDFRMTNTVTVGSTLTGYARGVSGGVTSLGDLALDCATTPNGNICGTSNFAVAKSTSGTNAGTLSGYGWNDSIGWVSFGCDHSADPVPGTNDCATLGTNPTGSADYNVRMDSSGNFWGWAWNDVVGWISFNCDHSADSPATLPPFNTNTCGASNYYVKSGTSQVSWAELESIPFDTLRPNGAGFNSIMWQGSAPSGTNVKFQIATFDNPSNQLTYLGPDGTANTYYQPTGPNVPLRINRTNHNNNKYVAYRVILESDPALSSSPTVTKIILNWSH